MKPFSLKKKTQTEGVRMIYSHKMLFRLKIKIEVVCLLLNSTRPGVGNLRPEGHMQLIGYLSWPTKQKLIILIILLKILIFHLILVSIHRWYLINTLSAPLLRCRELFYIYGVWKDLVVFLMFKCDLWLRHSFFWSLPGFKKKKLLTEW